MDRVLSSLIFLGLLGYPDFDPPPSAIESFALGASHHSLGIARDAGSRAARVEQGPLLRDPCENGSPAERK